MLTAKEIECLRACNECAAACLQCATACLQEDNPKSMARCIALDLECAEICRLAASSIAMSGAQKNAVCALCATACEACAAECGKHSMDHCQKCAEACKRCADARSGPTNLNSRISGNPSYFESSGVSRAYWNFHYETEEEDHSSAPSTAYPHSRIQGPRSPCRIARRQDHGPAVPRV